MSEPENFLSRWSRRKIEAEQAKDTPQGTGDASQQREPNPSARPREDGDPEPREKTESQEAAETAALDPHVRGNERGTGSDDSKEPEFDLSTLPSLDSITAETDIRVFLQKGVPPHLTRAALRRAWSADPNIRDFIGIAEN